MSLIRVPKKDCEVAPAGGLFNVVLYSHYLVKKVSNGNNARHFQKKTHVQAIGKTLIRPASEISFLEVGGVIEVGGTVKDCGKFFEIEMDTMNGQNRFEAHIYASENGGIHPTQKTQIRINPNIETKAKAAAISILLNTQDPINKNTIDNARGVFKIIQRDFPDIIDCFVTEQNTGAPGNKRMSGYDFMYHLYLADPDKNVPFITIYRGTKAIQDFIRANEGNENDKDYFSKKYSPKETRLIGTILDLVKHSFCEAFADTPMVKDVTEEYETIFLKKKMKRKVVNKCFMYAITLPFIKHMLVNKAGICKFLVNRSQSELETMICGFFKKYGNEVSDIMLLHGTEHFYRKDHEAWIEVDKLVAGFINGWRG